MSESNISSKSILFIVLGVLLKVLSSVLYSKQPFVFVLAFCILAGLALKLGTDYFIKDDKIGGGVTFFLNHYSYLLDYGRYYINTAYR